MVKSFKNIYNFLFIASCIIIIILYYQKCQETNILEGLDIPGIPKPEQPTVDSNRMKEILSNLVTNEERSRLQAKNPKYYEEKFTDLNEQYYAALEERKKAEIEKNMNPNDNGYVETYLEKNRKISEINSQFQSFLNEFLVDSENVKNYINDTDENVANLIDKNKEHNNLHDSLKGSDQTAKKMYSDYVLNYKNSYKTILFTIVSIVFFYTVVYYEIKSDPDIIKNIREKIQQNSGETNLNKLIIVTMAVGSSFALLFVFVYSLIRRLIREYVEQQISDGEEPEVYKIPSYSINFGITERVDENDEEESTE